MHENEIKYDSGQLWGHKYTQTGYATAPAIGTVFDFSLIGAGLDGEVGFNDIFDVYFNEKYFDNINTIIRDTSDGM